MPARTLSTKISPQASNVGTTTIAPDGGGLYRALLMRLPHRVRESLDHDQREALRVAAEELRWGRHSVDVRLSLPLPGLPVYVAFFAGFERRGWRKWPAMRGKSISNPAGLALIAVSIAAGLTIAWWWLGGTFG